ncbi:MFS transporter [Microbacterium sp. STN6]|uniref:MFS transporter n=1 Tax=Microbacterium sp. STN6 TaxID=2995588 RepID=UPI002260F978|nr:MFS transporter [Microbacterium sp. STN6]MCX7521079.1 MFS transporter [Microbacterium sp. STN6]
MNGGDERAGDQRPGEQDARAGARGGGAARDDVHGPGGNDGSHSQGRGGAARDEVHGPGRNDGSHSQGSGDARGGSGGRGAETASADSLWRHGGFLKLWAGETASQLGTQLTQLAVPVLAITLLAANEFQVGVLNAAETAAFLVVGLPAGAWVDRWLKRRVMIAADVVRAVALAMIPLLWALGMLQMWHVYVIAAVVGSATVFFDVSYQSYIPLLVRSSQVSDANGHLETTAQVARIGGPALGGALLTVVSAPLLLLGDALSYVVSFLFLARIRDEERQPDRGSRMSLRHDIAEGLAFVWNHRLIRVITATTGTTNFFGTIAMTLLSLLVLRELRLGAAGLGVIMSAGAVGGLLGALATPWLGRRLGEGTIIPLAAVVSGLAMLLWPVAALVPAFALPLLIAAEFVFSFTVLVYNIAQVSFRQRVCPPRLLGRMNASIRFVVWGVMPIGSLISGVLGSTIGVVPTLWIGAVGSVLGCAFTVFSPLLGMRRLPGRAAEDDGAAPVESAGAAPVESAGAAPVESAGSAPVENAGAAPVENAGAAPVENDGRTDGNGP